MLARTPKPFELIPSKVVSVVSDAFDDVAGRYDATYDDERCRAEDTLLSHRLEAFLRPFHNGTLLDVGCGTGLFLRLVEWPQNAYAGIDISPAMLRRARMSFPRGTFICDSIDRSEVPVEPETFDVAVSLFSALSYVAAPLAALENIAQALKPGGRCFLMVYAPRWLHEYSHRVPSVDLVTAPAAWSCWQAEERLRRTGFHKVRLTAFSMLPTPLLSLERFLPFARMWPGRGRYLLMEGTRR